MESSQRSKHAFSYQLLNAMRLPIWIIALNCLFFISCNQLYFQPSPDELYLLNPNPKLWEDRFIATPDGGRLHARLFHSQQDSSKGLIVHFHGNAENLTSHFMHFFWIVNEGYDYLIFDYSGYGKSTGLPSRQQAIIDGKATLQYAWDSIPSARTQLVVIGQSLGGALVVPAVAQWPLRDKIRLLVLDATFDRYPTEARRVLAAHWPTWPLQGLGWLLVSGAENPLDYYPLLSNIPALVTHCGDDKIVSADFAAEIFAELPGPDKQLWTFPKCGHTGFFHFPRTQGRRKLTKLLAVK